MNEEQIPKKSSVLWAVLRKAFGTVYMLPILAVILIALVRASTVTKTPLDVLIARYKYYLPILGETAEEEDSLYQPDILIIFWSMLLLSGLVWVLLFALWLI